MTRPHPVRRRAGALALALASAVACFAPAAPSVAAGIDTTAKQAILVDLSTKTVLLEKAADQRVPTSSMSKMMTAYFLYDAIRQKRVTLEDRFEISQKAWRMGGSKMFATLGDRVRIEDLIRGLVVQSGNDAAVAIAEGLSGSEEAFAAAITEKARAIGMKDSAFKNASGWPAEGHLSTVRDLATLAERLITDFPEFYHYDAETEFTWNGIKQGNRNPLLYRNMNVDGLKTGHTEVAGYGLAASGERDGRRLILVVNGLPSMQARADESARLLEWGWRSFAKYDFVRAQEPAGDVRVLWGEADAVPAVMSAGVALTMERGKDGAVKISRTVAREIEAPVVKGTVLGKAVVEAPGQPPREVDIVAAADVPRAGLLRMIEIYWNELVAWVQNLV